MCSVWKYPQIMLFLGALCPNQQNVYDVWMQDFEEPVLLQRWHIYRQDTRLVLSGSWVGSAWPLAERNQFQ